MKRLAVTTVLFLITFALFAQSEAPIRKGFTIGGSAGIGALHFTKGMESSETQGDISLPNVKIGWFVKDNLAIYLNTPGQIYEQNGSDRSFEGFIPSIQYWTSDRWWISGGLGAALDTPAFYEKRSESEEKNNWGKGVLLSSGYELLQRKKWAIDIQARLYMASVKLDNGNRREGTAFSIALGFTLF